MFRSMIGPLVAVSLASCASLPRDRGQSEFQALMSSRTGLTVATAPEAREAALADARARLGKPLGLADAVAIALASGADAQEELAELGIAYADLAEASRPSNPSISFGALDSDEPGTDLKLS